MLWIGGLLLLIGAIVWLWRKGMEPAANAIESPARALAAIDFLLERGINGATVRIQHGDDGSRAVVVTKHIVSLGQVRLRGRYVQRSEPDVVLSELASHLQEQGIPTTLSREGSVWRLETEYLPDARAALSFVERVFLTVFNAELRQPCVAYFEGVEVNDAATLIAHATNVKHSER